jgi:hypothetical protein
MSTYQIFYNKLTPDDQGYISWVDAKNPDEALAKLEIICELEGSFKQGYKVSLITLWKATDERSDI